MSSPRFCPVPIPLSLWALLVLDLPERTVFPVHPSFQILRAWVEGNEEPGGAIGCLTGFFLSAKLVLKAE